MSLPDVPDGLDPGMFDLLRAMKHAVERVDGEQVQNDKAMTFDDAIAIGLIDDDGTPASTLIGLTDTPAAYDDGKYLKSTPAGTEWTALAAGIAIGTAIPWLTGAPPAGYLECDGSAISRTTYSDLFAVISDDYGVGDGSTTFNLPDFRGEFLRGWDHGKGSDPDAATRTDRGDGTTGDNVGTKQVDELKSHLHTVYMEHSYGFGTLMGAESTGSYGRSYQATTETGGDETRPVNINVMYCIKY